MLVDFNLAHIPQGSILKCHKIDKFESFKNFLNFSKKKFMEFKWGCVSSVCIRPPWASRKVPLDLTVQNLLHCLTSDTAPLIDIRTGAMEDNPQAACVKVQHLARQFQVSTGPYGLNKPR